MLAIFERQCVLYNCQRNYSQGPPSPYSTMSRKLIKELHNTCIYILCIGLSTCIIIFLPKLVICWWNFSYVLAHEITDYYYLFECRVLKCLCQLLHMHIHKQIFSYLGKTYLGAEIVINKLFCISACGREIV